MSYGITFGPIPSWDKNMEYPVEPDIPLNGSPKRVILVQQPIFGTISEGGIALFRPCPKFLPAHAIIMPPLSSFGILCERALRERGAMWSCEVEIIANEQSEDVLHFELEKRRLCMVHSDHCIVYAFPICNCEWGSITRRLYFSPLSEEVNKESKAREYTGGNSSAKTQGHPACMKSAGCVWYTRGIIRMSLRTDSSWKGFDSPPVHIHS
ncbi:hypothetical protein K438DRAFT_1764446 [Mycena galopus ATCC 62051]|nr:hypothetical protein K438DRAFT_1764446 [Mycena galopus ATCC 62051]